VSVDGLAVPLRTRRLLLEPLDEAHIGQLLQLWSDELVRRYLGGVVPPEQARGRLQEMLRHWDRHGFGAWAVREQASGRLLGHCGLAHLELPEQQVTGEVELVYQLFPWGWGCGFATEAAAGVVGYGFAVLGLEQLVALTQAANRASWRLLERLGMRHDRDLWVWGAVRRYYVLVRADWPAGCRPPSDAEDVQRMDPGGDG
jgi:ribosomal-protein-alanine N-acetyltransferase